MTIFAKFLFLLIFPVNFIWLLPEPDSVNKKVHFNPHIQTDPRQPALARARLYHAGD